MRSIGKERTTHRIHSPHIHSLCKSGNLLSSLWSWHIIGYGDAGDISLKLKFIDPKGRELLQGEISASLDDSEAGRYQETFLEDSNACLDSSTRIQVIRATTKIGKKTFDLLKLRKLVVDDFKPMSISITK